MERLTNRDKEIPLPNADNALFWARVHEKLARYEDAEPVIIKPQTNADRIRAMTDEELAELMAQTGTEYSCPPPHYFAETGFCRNEDVDMSCRMCWLDWLRQEATNVN